MQALDQMIKYMLMPCLKNTPHRYPRGAIDTANFLVRACIAVPEVELLKVSLKILACLYACFGDIKYCVGAWERLRDVAKEDMDWENVMLGFK